LNDGYLRVLKVGKAYHWGDFEEFELRLIEEDMGRNYELFGILAGVRRQWRDPIDNLRGIPEDVGDHVLACYEDWGIDAHSPTWYTLRELDEYFFKNSDIEDDEYNFNYFRKKIESWKQLAFDPEDDMALECVRAVMWFDN